MTWLWIGALTMFVTSTTVFFSLWVAERRQRQVLESNLEGERQARRQLRERYEQLRSGRRGTLLDPEVLNRDDVDEIRERYRNWNEDDDQTYF